MFLFIHGPVKIPADRYTGIRGCVRRSENSKIHRRAEIVTVLIWQYRTDLPRYSDDSRSLILEDFWYQKYQFLHNGRRFWSEIESWLSDRAQYNRMFSQCAGEAAHSFLLLEKRIITEQPIKYLELNHVLPRRLLWILGNMYMIATRLGGQLLVLETILSSACLTEPHKLRIHIWVQYLLHIVKYLFVVEA